MGMKKRIVTDEVSTVPFGITRWGRSGDCVSVWQPCPRLTDLRFADVSLYGGGFNVFEHDCSFRSPRVLIEPVIYQGRGFEMSVVDLLGQVHRREHW